MVMVVYILHFFKTKHTSFSEKYKKMSERFYHLVEQFKRKSVSVYLNRSRDVLCFCLMMTHLMDPWWKEIACDVPMLSTVFCFKTQTANFSYSNESGSPCFRHHLKISTNCYFFSNINTSVLWKSIKCSEVDVVQLVPVFDAIRVPFPSVWSVRNNSFVKYHRMHHMYEIKKTQKQGFFVKAASPKQIFLGENLIECKGGAFVSAAFASDNVVDCPDNDPIVETQKCKLCRKLLQGTLVKIEPHIRSVFCLSFTSILPCEKISVFRKYSKNFSDNGTRRGFQQQVTKQLPCEDGKPDAFLVSDICKFQLNAAKQLFPCSNGGHMENCELLECNMMFKCPNHYCIPWHYVCDGKWDCPLGDDEHVFLPDFVRNCVQMFACQQSVACIPLGQVCDDVRDCPEGDDELLCQLKRYPCPSEYCECFLLIVVCNDVKTDNVEHFLTRTVPFLGFFISDSDPMSVKAINHKSQLTAVQAQRCKIKTICQDIASLATILMIDFSFNKIKTIQKNCFVKITCLSLIHLAHNHLTWISSPAFVELPALRVLNLSYNSIQELSSLMFKGSFAGLGLVIDENELSHVQSTFFETLQIRQINTTQFAVCCVVAENVACISDKPRGHMCSLLHSLPLRICCASISVVVFALNVSCILVVRCTKNRSAKKFSHKHSKVFHTILISLNRSNLLLGMYLAVMVGTDVYFGKTYSLNKQRWPCIFLCSVATVLSVSHSLMSPSFLFFFSLSRLMVVVHPMKTKFKDKGFVVRWLLLFVTVSSLFGIGYEAAVQSVPTFLSEKTCFPFCSIAETKILQLSLISISSSVQIMMTIVTLCFSILLVFCMKKSRSAIQHHTSEKHSVIATYPIVQVSLLNCSHMLSWLPLSFVHIWTGFLGSFSFEVVQWLVCLLAPLNSLVYPLVFIVLHAKKLQWKCTLHGQCSNVCLMANHLTKYNINYSCPACCIFSTTLLESNHEIQDCLLFVWSRVSEDILSHSWMNPLLFQDPAVHWHHESSEKASHLRLNPQKAVLLGANC